MNYEKEMIKKYGEKTVKKIKAMLDENYGTSAIAEKLDVLELDVVKLSGKY